MHPMAMRQSAEGASCQYLSVGMHVMWLLSRLGVVAQGQAPYVCESGVAGVGVGALLAP